MRFTSRVVQEKQVLYCTPIKWIRCRWWRGGLPKFSEIAYGMLSAITISGICLLSGHLAEKELPSMCVSLGNTWF